MLSRKITGLVLALAVILGIAACDPSPVSGDPVWEYEDGAQNFAGIGVDLWIGKDCNQTEQTKFVEVNNSSGNLLVSTQSTNYSNPTVFISHQSNAQLKVPDGRVLRYYTGARNVRNFQFLVTDPATSNGYALVGILPDCNAAGASTAVVTPTELKAYRVVNGRKVGAPLDV